MNQAKYSWREEVLKGFGMEDWDPTLDTKMKFVKLSNEEDDADVARVESVPYKSATGSLMYAMVAAKG